MSNKRLLNIVRILLQQDTYTTIQQISKQLEVSNKTIRNDLYQVGQWLEENDLKLIKKTGVGIMIEGGKATKLNAYHLIQEKDKQYIDYSPDARRIYIGMKLILHPNYRIYELANELYVSRATIHKDLKTLSLAFEPFKIQLYRKNNNGVSIEGHEKNIRNFLIELMNHDNGFSIFSKMIKDTNYTCDGSCPFAAIDFNDDEILEFIKLIEQTNSSYLHSLRFESLVQVILHILVTFIRVSMDHNITLSAPFMKELESRPYYEDVKELCMALEKHYPIHFDESELRYLQVFFLSLQNQSIPTPENEEEIQSLTKQLISEWQKRLPRNDLSHDQELYDAILNHLRSAITRFKHGILMDNPLMSDIEAMYSNTFAIVKSSIFVLEDAYHCKISNDEIGFFTLHLATALDRSKKPLSTLLVSHGSIGATNLLIHKLKSQFPELDIRDTLNFVTVQDANFDDIDLILTTTELSIQAPVDVITINVMLYDHDIIRLKSVIQSYYKEKNDPEKSS